MQNLLNLVIKVFLIMWDTESAGIENDKENISQIIKQKGFTIFTFSAASVPFKI